MAGTGALKQHVLVPWFRRPPSRAVDVGEARGCLTGLYPWGHTLPDALGRSSAKAQSSWGASMNSGSRESSGRRSLVIHSLQRAGISGLFWAQLRAVATL